MKISLVSIRLKAANIPPFEDRIAGAAEFGIIQEDTLNDPTAYVIQLNEVAIPNEVAHEISQKVTESFGVVVALRNDQSQQDKTGLTAFDQLFDVRAKLFNSLVGWEFDDEDDSDGFYPEGPVYYKGGVLLDVNPAWLWYQFEFEYPGRLQRTLTQGELNDLDTISAQYVLTPDAQIPLKGAAALPGAITDSDLDQIINLTENLLAGAFDRGFSSGFDLYKGT